MTLVVRALQNSALTSNGAHWSNGTGPVAGCTLAANGFSCIIDSNLNIGGAANVSVNAGSFVTGVWYQITSVGSTTWTAIGASSNSVGVVFQATGAGSGTGVAITQATITTAAAGSAVAGGGFALSASISLQADIRAGTANCITVSGGNGYTLSGVRVIGGTSASVFGISHTGSGAINLNSGCSVIGGTAATAHGINVSGGGAVNVSAGLDIRGGSGSGAGPAGINYASGSGDISNGTIVNAGTSSSSTITPGIAIAAGVNVNFNGSIANGGSVNATNYAISCLGTLAGTGNVFNAGTIAPAVDASTNGFLNLPGCTFNASSGAHAITGRALVTHVLSGTINDFVADGSGTRALDVRRLRDGSTSPSTTTERRAGSGAAGDARFLYGAGAATLGYPAVGDVRISVVYGQGNEFTGTLQTTIVQSPTPADVAAQVRTELAVELARIDQPTSSRLAPDFYQQYLLATLQATVSDS